MSIYVAYMKPKLLVSFQCWHICYHIHHPRYYTTVSHSHFILCL